MADPSYHVVTLAFPKEKLDLENMTLSILEGELYGFGCLGIEEIENNDEIILKTYFNADVSLDELQKSLEEKFPYLCWKSTTLIGLGESQFRAYTFEPFPVVPEIWIVPPEDLSSEASMPLQKNTQTITIRPGMAFGTGRHETTQLVAQFLWDMKPAPLSVLDVGTGSGILAILARKMGVSKIVAVEIDEQALENAHQNFILNQCNYIQLFKSIGDITGTYDAVLGNILTTTILHLKSELLSRLKPGGRLILSGITTEEHQKVIDSFPELTLLQAKNQGCWVGLILQKTV